MRIAKLGLGTVGTGIGLAGLGVLVAAVMVRDTLDRFAAG